MRDEAVDTGVLTRMEQRQLSDISPAARPRACTAQRKTPASASGKGTRADSAHTTVNWLAPGRARAQAAYKHGCSTRTTTPVLRTRIFSNPGSTPSVIDMEPRSLQRGIRLSISGVPAWEAVAALWIGGLGRTQG